MDSIDRAFRISVIVLVFSGIILILFFWTTVKMPIEWLENPINVANYPVMVNLVKVLNALSGFDFLLTLLSLISTMITGIIKVAKS